jgi:hypothetical protein
MHFTPRQPNSMANIRPAGPPPTMTTSVMFMSTPLSIRDLARLMDNYGVHPGFVFNQFGQRRM